MKVLVVSHLFPDPRSPHAGIFVQRQVEALTELGHSVRVIAPRPYVPKVVARLFGRTASSDLPREDRIGSVPVQYPRHFSLPGSTTLPIVAFAFRRTIAKHRDLFEWADVVNAHVAVPDGFASYPNALRMETPLVTTIHGADLQHSIDRPLVKPLVERTIGASTDVIVNSTKLLRLLNAGVSPECRSHIVHNGIPLDLIEAASPALNRGDNLRLISVGNLVETKGHRYVLDAVAELDVEVSYVVVGDGPERDSLEKQAQQLDIAERVSFVGSVVHKEVFDYLKSADIFVLPSYEEAFGIAYLEAMACGLPTIACEGEGPEDFITDRRTGCLVPPRNTAAIVETLGELLTDCRCRDIVGRRALQVAHERFSWKRNAKAVSGVYEASVDDRPNV